MKCFWSDNRTEFINLTMNLFCRKNEIIYKTTNLYLSEQNGITEHIIAIFFEMVQYMLHVASVDLCYWGEAFIYAVHIHLLTATSSLKDIVPYKAWTGWKLNIFHLCIWRSFRLAYISKQAQKGKLKFRMVSVRLLGWWNNETKEYRLEDLESGGGKVIVS